jgi:hypothetical protein
MKKHYLSRMFSVILIGAAAMQCVGLSFAACFLEAGWPVDYDPDPPCPRGKDNTGMCFKWVVTDGGYGFGPCVSSSDGASGCDQEEKTLYLTEYIGMCNGANCIMQQPLMPNGPPIEKTRVFSWTYNCFSQ